MKKYAIHPGMMPSANDNDVHYIDAYMLIHLYGLNPKECVIVRRTKEGIVQQDIRGLINLGPQYLMTDYERIREQLHNGEIEPNGR